MKVSNGIKIAMANKPLCYKTLLSRTLVSLILTIACFLIAKIVVDDVTQSEAYKSLITFLRTSLKNVIAVNDAANVNFAADFASHLQQVWVVVRSTELTFVVVGIVIVIQIAKFVVGICDYVVAVNVNEHMSSLRHAKFFSTLAEHFKHALGYASYCVVSLFFYNILVIAIVFGLFVLLIGPLGILAMPILLAVIFVADAFRLMLVGMIPAKMVCEGISARFAFKQAFKGLDFRTMAERFISYFTMRLLSIVVTVCASLATFGISLFITFPLFTVSYMAVRFVDYYTVNIKKYYVTFDNIVIPKELRTKGEQLLNQVDIDA